MKFKINQSILNKGLSTVQKAITSRSTIRELEGVLITLENNTLKLTGTDAEIISIETSLECNGEKDGKTLVNARLFGDIIRKLPDDVIRMEKVGDKLKIKCKNSDFELLVYDYMEFPSISDYEVDNFVKIKDKDLKQAIKQTSFAVSLDYNRRSLTGVNFEVKDGEIKFAALDGYRLSVLKRDATSKEECSVIVPGRSLGILNSILNDDDEEVLIEFSRNNIRFKIGKTYFYSQLVDGQFFNYRDILRDDSEHATIVKVNRSEFQRSLERAELLAKEEKANLVKLEFEEDTLTIQSNSEFGKVQELVQIETEGPNQKIAFNSRYLLDGIKNMDDEEIKIELLDDVNPMIIVGIDNPYYLYLVLPVRLA